MISICEYCAYKTADCDGDKNIEKVACQYFKKPLAVNFKKMAEELALAERDLNDTLEENSKLREQIAELKQKDVYCWDDCNTCPNRCRAWQNGYNYNEHFRKKYEDMAEENSRLSHDNFVLKKEIAELNRTIEELTQISTDWRAEAIQKWVDSKEEKTCSRCIHYDKEEWELPCVRCSKGNKDYWKGDNNG